MSAAVELGSRLRVSDPKPDRCAACFRGADAETRFVDFDAAIDRGQVVHESEGVVIHREGIDDLHLCEACVRSAAELIAFKPELHSRQLREIRRLEIAVEHWQSYAKRFEAVVKDRPEPVETLRAVKRGQRA